MLIVIESLRSVMANVLDYDIVVSELEPKLPYYVDFWTNALKFLRSS